MLVPNKALTVSNEKVGGTEDDQREQSEDFVFGQQRTWGAGAVARMSLDQTVPSFPLFFMFGVSSVELEDIFSDSNPFQLVTVWCP